jgi:hypothetical protein
LVFVVAFSFFACEEEIDSATAGSDNTSSSSNLPEAATKWCDKWEVCGKEYIEAAKNDPEIPEAFLPLLEVTWSRDICDAAHQATVDAMSQANSSELEAKLKACYDSQSSLSCEQLEEVEDTPECEDFEAYAEEQGVDLDFDEDDE